MYQLDSIFRGISKPTPEPPKAAGEHPPRMVLNRREGRRQQKSTYKDSLQMTDYSFAVPPNTPIVDRTESMPTDLNDDLAEIKRTCSGGLMLFRKKSAAEQEAISQARALQMIEQFELSDEKNTELNRKALFGAGPNDANEAVLANGNKKEEEKQRKRSTDLPLNAQQTEIAQQKEKQCENTEKSKTEKCIWKGKKVSSLLSRTPLRKRQANYSNTCDDALLKAKALQRANSDDNSDALGVEVVMDVMKGTLTLLPSPTGVEAIAPPARGYFYRLPNGRTFDIPHLC